MGLRKSPKLLARYEALTGKPHVIPPPPPHAANYTQVFPVPVAPHNEDSKGPTP